MNITAEMIIALTTAGVTYLFGWLAKKFKWVESKYIPIQNVVIGLIGGIGCYIFGVNTDLTSALIFCLFGSLTAGGTYDLAKTGKGE